MYLYRLILIRKYIVLLSDALTCILIINRWCFYDFVMYNDTVFCSHSIEKYNMVPKWGLFLKGQISRPASFEHGIDISVFVSYKMTLQTYS